MIPQLILQWMVLSVFIIALLIISINWFGSVCDVIFEMIHIRSEIDMCESKNQMSLFYAWSLIAILTGLYISFWILLIWRESSHLCATMLRFMFGKIVSFYAFSAIGFYFTWIVQSFYNSTIKENREKTMPFFIRLQPEPILITSDLKSKLAKF